MKLHIISAGAAQSVVQPVAAAFEAENGVEIAAIYGAVGAQRERLLAGAPADVVILTAAMIDKLIESGHVVADSRADLGAVGAGIAVRSGAPGLEASSPTTLAAGLQTASAVYIPDPAIATAGMHFMKMCSALGIVDTVRPKLRTFPNGYAAMTALASDMRFGLPIGRLRRRRSD